VAGTRMVVVGGDAAGMSAASQARKRRGPEELAIVVFERGRHVSYSACGTPYYAGGVVKDWRDLVARTPEEFASQGIEVRTGHEVDAIDLEAGRVRVHDLDGDRIVEEPWDLLVVATGSEPLRPPIDGIDLPGVYGLSVLQDGIDLRQAIDAGPERAVIVGGGYIGLEAAEALVNRGVSTALVEAAPQVMNRIDPDMGELISDAVRDIGVELYLEEEVEAIEGDGRVRAVRTAGRTLEADLVVLGLGTRPATGLAES
jgi:NADPH-dependent 2,4-dienoyl-CoA reductase/sulfur reductase-like enzyme